MKHILDVKHLLCPMPVIRLGELATQLKAGDTVTMQCTDPGVQYDVPAWCRVHGLEIMSIKNEDYVWFIEIKMPEGAPS